MAKYINADDIKYNWFMFPETDNPAKMAVTKDKIDAMPSAQPEIIRCKDCKYQDKGSNDVESWNLCVYRPWLHVPTDDEHFCSYSEMRGEQE